MYLYFNFCKAQDHMVFTVVYGLSQVDNASIRELLKKAILALHPRDH